MTAFGMALSGMVPLNVPIYTISLNACSSDTAVSFPQEPVISEAVASYTLPSTTTQQSDGVLCFDTREAFSTMVRDTAAGVTGTPGGKAPVVGVGTAGRNQVAAGMNRFAVKNDTVKMRPRNIGIMIFCLMSIPVSENSISQIIHRVIELLHAILYS